MQAASEELRGDVLEGVAAEGSPPELEPELAREWLETDGLGGDASSAVALSPTRRHHGLLAARLPGSARRLVVLSRLDEVVRVGGVERELACVRWSDVLAPRGDLAVRSFEAEPWPRWELSLGEHRLVRELIVPRGERAVLVRWTLHGPSGVQLRLRPFLPLRDSDALTMRNDAVDPRIRPTDGGFTVQPYAGLPVVHIEAPGSACEVRAEPVWHERLRFTVDEARGYEGFEDQFSPALLLIGLEPGESAVLRVTLGSAAPSATSGDRDARAHWRLAIAARRASRDRWSGSSLRASLSRRADDFLYRADSGRLGVVAGWPWFGEWGRDTYLSLPGLLLARGDHELCEEALRGALEFLQGGLLPNVFGIDRASSHYGSADAALWFALAVRRLDRARARLGGELGAIERDFREPLTEIACAIATPVRSGEPAEHARATGDADDANDPCAKTVRVDPEGLGLALDEAGLLVAGSRRHNATWMDARVDGVPVTPRAGCAVELNALWIQLLAQLECAWEDGPRKAVRTWRRRRKSAERAFEERFWLSRALGLADVWEDGARDRSLRPNMVLAAALEHSPLSRERRGAVAALAERELLTPRGLRTLAPSDARYRPRYQGDGASRDSAYHQGTAWPWLTGAWVETSLRAKSPGPKRIARLRGHVEGFGAELTRIGLGHVSEVFDGDAPQRGNGTIAQAWNTAELLRALALLEDGEA